MLVDVVPAGTVTVLVEVTDVVPCFVIVDVIVVFGLAVAVACTETVDVPLPMDRQLHALDNGAPEEYDLRAEGRGTAVACLFWF